PISITRPAVTVSNSTQSPMRKGASKPSAMPESTSASTLRMAKPRMAMIRPELASTPPEDLPISTPTASMVATVNSVTETSSRTSLGARRRPLELPWRDKGPEGMREQPAEGIEQGNRRHVVQVLQLHTGQYRKQVRVEHVEQYGRHTPEERPRRHRPLAALSGVRI